MVKSNLEIMSDRKRLIGSGIQTFCDELIELEKGECTWVWDEGDISIVLIMSPRRLNYPQNKKTEGRN